MNWLFRIIETTDDKYIVEYMNDRADYELDGLFTIYLKEQRIEVHKKSLLDKNGGRAYMLYTYLLNYVREHGIDNEIHGIAIG